MAAKCSANSQRHRVVDRVVLGQPQRDPQHGKAVKAIQAGAVRLLESNPSAVGQAVDRFDIVQAEEAPWNTLLPSESTRLTTR